MVRESLFLSLSVLSTFSIFYAAEEKKGVRRLFCTFHSAERVEAEKEAKEAGKKDLKPSGMKSICLFHKDHEKDTPIKAIRYPDLTAWHDTSDDVGFDAYIAGFRKIPYLYEQIKKQPNLNANVLKYEYEPPRDDALIYLGEQEKKLSDRSEDEPIRRRIQEYVTILKESTVYKHECVGLIVSERAVMVALQWAHFADDHTDKGKEDLKKTLVGDDSLVELCSELDTLVVQSKNKDEASGSSESFDPRRETLAEYQLKQTKKYDPCGW
jgi:hypothetical protein